MAAKARLIEIIVEGNWCRVNIQTNRQPKHWKQMAVFNLIHRIHEWNEFTNKV